MHFRPLSITICSFLLLSPFNCSFAEPSPSGIIAPDASESSAGRGSGRGRGGGMKRQLLDQGSVLEKAPLTIWVDAEVKSCLELYSAFYADNFPVDLKTSYGEMPDFEKQFLTANPKPDFVLVPEGTELGGLKSESKDSTRLFGEELVLLGGSGEELKGLPELLASPVELTVFSDSASGNPKSGKFLKNAVAAIGHQGNPVNARVTAVQDLSEFVSKLNMDPKTRGIAFRSEVIKSPDLRRHKMHSFSPQVIKGYSVISMNGGGSKKAIEHFRGFMTQPLAEKIYGRFGYVLITDGEPSNG